MYWWSGNIPSSHIHSNCFPPYLNIISRSVLTFAGKLSVVLAGTLVAADDALDVLLAVDLGSTVAALRVGAIRLGAGRGAATARGLSLDAGEHVLAMALDQGQHVGAVSGIDARTGTRSGTGVMATGGSTIGAGQAAGQILLDARMMGGSRLIEAGAREILLDHRRLLAGHAARSGTAAARRHAAGGGARSGGGGVQVTAEGGRRFVPGAVWRDAQPHRAGQADVEGRQLRAGLRARIEEAGSRGRGGAHDAAAVHAQRIVRNNFGGRVGTRGIIAGIHFVRTWYGSHFGFDRVLGSSF